MITKRPSYLCVINYARVLSLPPLRCCHDDDDDEDVSATNSSVCVNTTIGRSALEVEFRVKSLEFCQTNRVLRQQQWQQQPDQRAQELTASNERLTVADGIQLLHRVFTARYTVSLCVIQAPILISILSSSQPAEMSSRRRLELKCRQTVAAGLRCGVRAWRTFREATRKRARTRPPTSSRRIANRWWQMHAFKDAVAFAWADWRLSRRRITSRYTLIPSME